MKDKEIISMFFDRDQRAITATSEKYGDYVMKVAERILGSKYDAEECVNDGYLSLWNSIPPEKPKDLGAYLFRIVRNRAVDILKISSASKRSVETVSITEELSECLTDGRSAEDEYLNKELKKSLERFYKTLGSRERDIFFGRYYFAYDMKTIAEKTGLDEDYVRVVLSRTRNKLKKHLMKEGHI